MLKKLSKFFKIVKYFFKDEDLLFLYLLEMKAHDCLRDSYKLGIRRTEEIENLLFHISEYIDIPTILVNTRYPKLKGFSVKDIIRICVNGSKSTKLGNMCYKFLADLEKERAVERNFIFDGAKELTFGFKL